MRTASTPYDRGHRAYNVRFMSSIFDLIPHQAPSTGPHPILHQMHSLALGFLHKDLLVAQILSLLLYDRLFEN